MAKFNDIDLKNWKDYEDVETDSLWIISRRDNSGKHDGFYHGNFVPQIPRQMLKRYTKQNDIVLDAFMGSGTTAFECEQLKRNFVGIDLNPEMVSYVKTKLRENPVNEHKENFAYCIAGDSAAEYVFSHIREHLEAKGKSGVQHVILHPPYHDILKFSAHERDLSNCPTLENFVELFGRIVRNCLAILERGRYLSLVIGDKYTNGQWIPLGFYCMQEAIQCGLTLKSIIVKNMEGNRAKNNKNTIWRYRALSSDYYIFKHEYVMVFKKESA